MSEMEMAEDDSAELDQKKCCCFCACIDTEVKYKQTSCKNMLIFLEKNITPTPYLYSYLLNHSKQMLSTIRNEYELEEGYECNSSNVQLFTLCVNCDSWIRRQAFKKKAFLHADALFLNIMFPGNFDLPEERSCLRILHNACLCNDGLNFLNSIAPVVAQEFFAVFTEKYLLHDHDTPQDDDAYLEAGDQDEGSLDSHEPGAGEESTESTEHWYILSPRFKHNSKGIANKQRRHDQKSHVKNKLVYIWWQRNRRCEFLSNKYTAKLLRHIIHGMP